MRVAGFILSLLMTIGLVYFLNNPQPIGDGIPAMGKLLNPYSGFWNNAERVGANPEGEFSFKGLKGKVSVYYDDRRVPHIFAGNMADAAFVQGYVTARDRFFQMDLSTRATSGRLSEILGESLLGRDKWMRRKGMTFAAENAVREWQKDKENWAMLERYVDGVNAYVNDLSPSEYPLEYKLMGIKPEPWSTYKTALFVKAMAASLAERHMDVQATNALATFGRDTFDFLFPEYYPEQSPIIPSGTKWKFKATPVIPDTFDNDVIQIFDYSEYERSPEHYGSNNWAVAGSKTKSGNPILCGDPHLRLTLPAIWYEVQIKTPEINAYGVSLPGIPMVIIGFNENVAWSQTNVGQDVADLLKLKWKDESRQEYLLDGEWKQAELKIEEYKIKGGGVAYDTVPYTVWGPVLFQSKEGLDRDLAYRWLPHEASAGELRAFLDLNKAANYEEYDTALAQYDSPAQNYVFAAKDGDIAIRVTGKFPLKEEGQGRFVQDGSLSSSAWRGYIPRDQTPKIKNPKRGFVASANQHSTDESYPYYYNREKFENFRGRILNRKLEGMKNITIEDMMALQLDNYDLRAETALPLMLEKLDSTVVERHADMINNLSEWDYVFSGKSQIATFFHNWWRKFHVMLWDETYTSDVTMLHPHYQRTIELLRDSPESVFYDIKATDEQETVSELLGMALDSTAAMFKDGIPTWSEKQGSSITHLAQLPAFSLPVNTGGVGSALNAMNSFSGGTAGPSWRQIVELGEEVTAKVCYPGGQSGNPGSEHYGDFLEAWETGKYYDALFMKSEEDHARLMVGKEVYSNE